jgi:hypothetical protein
MPGPKNATGMINTVDNLLASTTGMETHPIVIEAGTLDATNPEGTAILRKGLVLTQYTSTAAVGKFTNHDSTDVTGLQLEANARVLRDRVDMGDNTKDVVATAYFRGSFKTSGLIVDDSGNFDWTAVPRLRRPE